ncbi:hypothetical protein TNCT_126301 [Trichonephila clavata]|uniref:Uncharacterized protein n=1 Tax=Trichonephila clavata TaxID=2740835 RepID=A0A8X6GXI5_TRICU|nr:hypothetical protein TNCT_126301 [Trichonephila clavata]
MALSSEVQRGKRAITRSESLPRISRESRGFKERHFAHALSQHFRSSSRVTGFVSERSTAEFLRSVYTEYCSADFAV